MLNINYGKNRELLENCRRLEEYSIFVAKVREYDFDSVSTQIDQLIELAERGKVFPTVQEMKKIVPEFKSKNSVYEKLDN